MARRRPLTDTERQERRRADRERIAEAVRELQSSEGWQRWVAVRRHNGLARYSLNNQLLVAIACWRRGISPTYVAGYRWWAEHGYQVRRGEAALRILAPLRRRVEDEETGERRLTVVGFRGVSVFDRSQVDAGVDAVDLEPPPVWPIAGDSHERYLEPVAEALRDVGVSVEFAPVEGSSARGYYHRTEKRIRVEAELEPNARLRTLLHEGAHALVAREAEPDGDDAEGDAPALGYAEEECIVEVAGHVAAAGLGLDTSCEAVPYVAGWGESAGLAAVERAASLVDRIAGWLERAAGAADDEPLLTATAA
ncbi:MAG: hypothetical protein GEU88_19600 [Solirubrobacterales bacterium]|nr:hypothetical protein [Solirubrobacterales bacterium]